MRRKSFLPKIKNIFGEPFFKIFSLVLLSILIFSAFSFGWYTFAYSKRVYPHIRIGKINLGGLEKSEVLAVLGKKMEELEKEGLVLKTFQESIPLSLIDIGLNYDPIQTWELSFSVGRRSSFLESLKEQFLAIFIFQEVSASYQIDSKKLKNTIAKIASRIDKEAKETTISITENEVEIIEGENGRRLNQEKVIGQIARQLSEIDPGPISLAIETLSFAVSKEDAQRAKEETERIISFPIRFVGGEQNFQADRMEIAKWLAYSPDKENKLQVSSDQEKIKKYSSFLAKKINQPKKDARLKMEGERVTVFQPSQEGLLLNQEKLTKEIIKIIEERKNQTLPATITLDIKKEKPAVETSDVNQLGIRELVGKASTSFKGSPENRRHNIQIGASIFNGILIRPGEVFSTLAILGEVSEIQGFRPELVIKEDRLKPEVGGGLCQISTTLFRAALNSGLEIIERSPHAFRVRYYEPPVGMDATIYNPSPDLKFKNDTPAWILIQGYVSGNNVTFQFYGTRDGREVLLSKPVVSNITPPGEPVYFEDPNLPKGEKKQLEKAVPGAIAFFNYNVRYPDGRVMKKTFNSKYVPWRAKFALGTKEEGTPPAPSETPSPSPTPTETLSPSPTP